MTKLLLFTIGEREIEREGERYWVERREIWEGRRESERERGYCERQRYIKDWEGESMRKR
jgi:hypothetical protein